LPEQVLVKGRGLPLSLLLAQSGHEPCPEHAAHCLYGEQVFALATAILPLAARRHASARDDAVQMWMQTQVLAPGMQNGDHARCCPHKLRVFTKIPDHRPGRSEKQAVKLLRFVQAQLVQRIGHGEDHMEIGHVQQFFLSRPDPRFPLVPLALRAVSVAATIVTKVQSATGWIVAAVDMAAKGRGTAFAQRMERPCLPAVGANAR
tara:strand:+ start:174190 stop:174804 length:615 start_codon:yes stop_codon:yes gene_type:complete